jgi:hypothetical protein
MEYMTDKDRAYEHQRRLFEQARECYASVALRLERERTALTRLTPGWKTSFSSDTFLTLLQMATDEVREEMVNDWNKPYATETEQTITIPLERYKRLQARRRELESKIMDWQRVTGKLGPWA